MTWTDRSIRSYLSQTTGPSGPRKNRGARKAPPGCASNLIDFFRPTTASRAGRVTLARAVTVAVAVRAAEHERRLHLELRFEPRAALLPAFLILELVLVQ